MSAAGPPRRGGVRVVTLNLWGGYHPLRQQVIGRMRPGGERPAAWTARQAALAAGLRALRPDLVAFQEALWTDELDQAVELLGPGYHVARQARREADGAGASVASRWPLGRVHEIDLRVTPRAQPEFPCVTLVAEVLAPEPVGPLLLADHDPGHTFTPDNPLLLQGTWPQELGRRIDYVMVRCRGHGPSLDIAACERIFDQPVDGVWATDHFGVVADLTVPPRTPSVAG